MKKPIIGITLDNEEPGDYSKFPWYAIRQNYLRSIEDLGGIPFPLIHSLNIINDISKFVDGIIITGGNFDVNPSLYGQESIDSRNEKNIRTTFEIKLCEIGLKKNIPILGICGGEQLINICLGGTLIQNIKSLDYKTLQHEQTNPRNEISHEVFLTYKTKLYNIINQKSIMVNSAHHQSVDKLGENLVINGKSKDGIIESIENTNHKWCIGVQWHPEFLITKADKLIIADFIKNSIE